MTKLVYILPVYDPDSPEHFYYLYKFLEILTGNLDVLIFIEKCAGPPWFSKQAKLYCRRLQWPVLNLLETLIVLVIARLKGYKRFYVHYSLSAGFISGLVTRLLGGISFYWNCGHPTRFLPSHIGNFTDFQQWLRNGLFLKLTLQIVHYLVTGTPAMADYYSGAYRLSSRRIQVMPNWVDLSRFADLPAKKALRQELGLPMEVPVVLFLHRLADRKGAHYLVPIAQRVTKTHQALFLVAGDGPYRSRLEAEIREAGMEDFFRLVGWVPNREVARYFGAADVYMMPSEEEGFPRTLLESMAAGCPFVATDVGGVRDVVTPLQAEFLVPPGKPDLFADALDRLLSDRELRHRLANEGQVRVKEFSQERVAEIFLEMVIQE